MSEIKVNSVVNSTGDNDSGLDLSTNDKIGIKIANAEVATVDTTGVVFNDASADRDFRVESNGNANMLFVDGGNDRIGIGTSSPSEQVNLVGSSGTSKIRFDGDSSNLQNNFIGITGYDDLIIASDEANSGSASTIQFRVDGSERMRVESGNLLINNTGASPLDSGRVRIYNNTAQDALKTYQATSGTTCLWNRIDHTASFFAVFRISTTTVGTINTNGSSTSYNTSSDYRLKESVSYDFDATTRLKQLKPCRFNWIADETNTLVDGFLAHEVQTIVPEAITGEKDAVDGDGNIIPQQIDQSKIVPLLVKTIQELEARITALENA